MASTIDTSMSWSWSITLFGTPVLRRCVALKEVQIACVGLRLNFRQCFQNQELEPAFCTRKCDFAANMYQMNCSQPADMETRTYHRLISAHTGSQALHGKIPSPLSPVSASAWE